MQVIQCVSSDMSADQRVHKMALTMAELDYSTLVLCRKRKQSRKLEERVYKVKRLPLFFDKKAFFYAELNIRFFFYLLFHRFTIAVANDLDTLPAVYLAGLLKNKKIVFDSHELFSEVPELYHRPKVKKVWQKLENFLIPRVNYGITVCDSIAHFYKTKYNKNFLVIPNLPIEQTPKVKSKKYYKLPDNKPILIYQGALNLARGIELMIQSLYYLQDWILVIAGEGDIEESLKIMVTQHSLNHRVFFMGQLDFSSLQSLTPLADIGLSLEEDMGLNYKFALPNKVFDYAQARIPCIVSDLPEMSQWIYKTKMGAVLKLRTPQALAELVKQVYSLKEEKAFDRAFKNVNGQLFWSNNQKKLHSLFKQLIL